MRIGLTKKQKARYKAKQAAMVETMRLARILGLCAENIVDARTVKGQLCVTFYTERHRLVIETPIEDH